MQTQWRTGFGGATGLDYLAVGLVAKTLGVRMHRLTLEKIQALEASQLHRWAEQRGRKSEGSPDGS